MLLLRGVRFVSAPLIRFCDVARMHQAQAREMEAAVHRVIASGSLILGPEVRAFERDVERFLGVPHAVGVGTGTDALTLTLVASGILPRDEVIVPTFTHVAALEAVRWAGATPRLVDTNEHREVDARVFRQAIGPRTRACILPSLHGRAARIGELLAIAEERNVAVIEDACQAFGATVEGRCAGTRGTAGCFSFYPTKVLGGVGDGGMVVTADDAVAEAVRSLRAHGATWSDKYRHVRLGTNSRLDELQAAILRVKLAELPQAIERRRRIAARYDAHLARHPWLRRPPLGDGDTFYAYVIACEGRDSLRDHLRLLGIEAPIHFPVPLHEQPAYAGAYSPAVGVFDGASVLCRTVLSLPCHPVMTDDEVASVCRAIDSFAAGR